ncbi:MAG: sulfotransferase [Acidimicrobiales bacterium]
MTPPESHRSGAPPPLDRLPDPRTRREWAALYLASALRTGDVGPLDEIERFCFFIGYARSGHTLVATLLNAHPDAVIAHELDAVRYVRHRFRRAQLFSLLLQRDRQFGEMGRTWSGYQYEVPGQFQGTYEHLRVIGDKRARSSVLQLADDPGLLDRFRRTVGVPIRVIHVTRNPFDNIATEARRQGMSLTEATEWYGHICRAVATVRPLLAPDELLDVAYEDFVGDTRPTLAALCHFVGLETAQAYLEACAGLVWQSPRRSRDSVSWSADERRGVERLIETYEILHGYRDDGSAPPAGPEGRED